VLTAAAVTPGLIDAHAVIGLTGALNVPADQDQDELSDPNQADLRALDGFHPNEPLLGFLRDHGVTVVHAMPGRANVIAGQSGVFRTYGRTAEQMTLKFPAAVLVNLGEAPKASYPGKAPQTRMATAALVRSQSPPHRRMRRRRLRPTPTRSRRRTRNWTSWRNAWPARCRSTSAPTGPTTSPRRCGWPASSS